MRHTNPIIEMIDFYKGSEIEIVDFVPHDILDEQARRIVFEFKDGSSGTFRFKGEFSTFRKHMQEAYSRMDDQ